MLNHSYMDPWPRMGMQTPVVECSRYNIYVLDIIITLEVSFIDIYCTLCSKTCDEGHLNKCPYMTGVPSSQVHFNVKEHFGSQKMQFRQPDRCPLVTGFTVLLK